MGAHNIIKSATIDTFPEIIERDIKQEKVVEKAYEDVLEEYWSSKITE